MGAACVVMGAACSNVQQECLYGSQLPAAITAQSWCTTGDVLLVINAAVAVASCMFCMTDLVGVVPKHLRLVVPLFGLTKMLEIVWRAYMLEVGAADFGMEACLAVAYHL
eukprot:GHRR01001263.1.p3 GENE.GHRR01001263.1~~GHRR01001263.1.p3  ORF type:complete len:110 (+),score=23.68 GHRR01001263.1:1548-1877(+)